MMSDMRRGVLACAMLLATVASASEEDASAQAEARRTFVGLVPIALGRSVIAVDGERVVGPKLSVRMGVRLGASLFNHESASGGVSQSDLSVGIEPGLRYYLTGTALDGLWMGAHLELTHAWSTTGSALSTMSGIHTSLLGRGHSQVWSAGAGTLVGYSMVLAPGLTVQAGVGLGVVYSSSQTETPGVNPGLGLASTSRSRWWAVSERARLAVGWAF
jgi:hypothetical protein